MARHVLADIAFTRAGDKGDISDVTLFTPNREIYDLCLEQVTAERVKALYGDLVKGDVTRYEVPNVLALKFVLEQALGGGGPSSLRADNLGKAMGGPLLRLAVEVPDDLAGATGAAADPAARPLRRRGMGGAADRATTHNGALRRPARRRHRPPSASLPSTTTTAKTTIPDHHPMVVRPGHGRRAAEAGRAGLRRRDPRARQRHHRHRRRGGRTRRSSTCSTSSSSCSTAARASTSPTSPRPSRWSSAPSTRRPARSCPTRR